MNFIKKWIGKVAAENLYPHPLEASMRSTNRLQDMLSDSGASVVAFQIENGFLVRTMRHNEDAIGGRYPGFVYCADHQAIADHIVSSAVREKLGVQQEMFPKHKQVSITSASRTAGLVGTQQANPSY
jgi:phosphomannomutase